MNVSILPAAWYKFLLVGRVVDALCQSHAMDDNDNDSTTSSSMLAPVDGICLVTLREIFLILVGVCFGLWYRNAQWKLNSLTLPFFGYFTGPILRILGLLVKIRVTPPTMEPSIVSNSSIHKDHQLPCGDNEMIVYNPYGEVVPKNYMDTPREANLEPHLVPKHVAFIMDGNRRYGKRKHGSGLMGHWHGGTKAIQVIEWCSTEGVGVITLYAFSTENWNRTPEEVAYLMDIFLRVVENDLRPIIVHRKLRFNHVCSDKDRIPPKLLTAIANLCAETEKFPEGNLFVNVCLSYGSRGEITNTFRELATECVAQSLQPHDITEELISQRLATGHCPDPDILIRTSGEERLSNFMLWQLAYSEFFFLRKDWPELEKKDLLDIFRTYARNRQRRFGK